MSFGKSQYFFLNEIKHESIPLWFLLITPILVLISIPISFYLYILKPKIFGLSGSAKYLKEQNKDIQIIIADPIGSVVADAVNTGNYKYEGGSWLVEGIGEDYIPDNLNLDIIDEGIYVSDKDAFARVDELLRKEGILAGTSCGTLVDAAIKWCQKQTEPKKVVTLICDTGNKYLSKAFNKDWLKENELID